MSLIPIDIPVDTYDSPQEFVVIMPLWGVQKTSVQVRIEWKELIVQWIRTKPEMKSSLVSQQENCYWWDFTKRLLLPSTTAFDRIHSMLSQENILTIIVPKVIVPEKIIVEIE
jgi:HSP20 family protein